MKKSLLAVAVLGAFAGAASAQSSVTLFGVVDLSVNSIENGSNRLRSMDSNQLNSNRLGFRGTEDLGGGLLASFWLEGGMANDTGSPTGFNFQRRSTVSLTSKMGELRLGRDYTNSFSTVATFDAYGANGFGNMSYLYASDQRTLANGVTKTLALGSVLGSGATTSVRANNMVGYFLPGDLGGLYGSVQVAAGEAVKGNKYVGGRLGWAAGPLNVSAGFSQTDVAADSKYKTANIGASYDFGVFKLLGFLDERKFAALKYSTYAVSTSIPMGQGEFRASYSKGNASGVGGAVAAVAEKAAKPGSAGTAAAAAIAAYDTRDNDATLFGVEYIYNLSKRTALYTQYGRLQNKGASNIQLGGVTTDADITKGGFTSTGYGVGVRHSF